jgi:pterin-4a-carbinolamine dehydratase
MGSRTGKQWVRAIQSFVPYTCAVAAIDVAWFSFRLVTEATGTMQKVRYAFISYRRLDSSIFSQMLAAQLQDTYGGNRVFIDVENIRGADVWPTRLEGALRQASVVIVVIGKSWLSAADESTRRRIDLPGDWVRREIETSLEEGKKILPVLIDDAQLPKREAIPDSIVSLIDHKAHIIDMERIAKDIRDLVNKVGILLNAKPTNTRVSYPFPILKINPLDKDNLNRLTAQLPAWSVVNRKDEDTELMRTYEFQSFSDAIHFINTASRFIDLKDHHPEWTNIWRTIVVHLSTWDIGRKPTILDADVATYLDRLYENYERQITQHDLRG